MKARQIRNAIHRFSGSITVKFYIRNPDIIESAFYVVVHSGAHGFTLLLSSKRSLVFHFTRLDLVENITHPQLICVCNIYHDTKILI